MRTRIRLSLIAVVVVTLSFSRGFSSPTSPVKMIPVPRDKMCITEGALEELKDTRLEVKVDKMRAVVAAKTDQKAEARLTYLGPTSTQSPLSSGETRTQFGLKLRAQDGCNLVYAMWRIEPKAELVVSIKRNPGMHASSECGNHGYHNIKPSHSARLPKLKKGESHSLLADMDGSKMRVSVDGKVVWEGDLGKEALESDGPVGVRSDNGRFEFQFLTGELGAPRDCRKGESD